MKIRPGTMDDFEAIDCFDPFGGDRKTELHQGHCHVAIIDEQVIGYITFKTDGFIGNPFISFLAVYKNYRRKKVATHLIEYAMQEINSSRVFISTEETNNKMLSLLKKMNWQKAGHVQGVNDDGSAEVFFYKAFNPIQG